MCRQGGKSFAAELGLRKLRGELSQDERRLQILVSHFFLSILIVAILWAYFVWNPVLRRNLKAKVEA